MRNCVKIILLIGMMVGLMGCEPTFYKTYSAMPYSHGLGRSCIQECQQVKMRCRTYCKSVHPYCLPRAKVTCRAGNMYIKKYPGSCTASPFHTIVEDQSLCRMSCNCDEEFEFCVSNCGVRVDEHVHCKPPCR